MKPSVKTILTLSLSLLYGSALGNVHSEALQGRGNRLCSTPECKAIADSILENMNTQADPCNDFYEFACGGFLKRKEIPPGQSSVSTIQFDRSDYVAKQLLEADPKTLNGIDGKQLDEPSLRNLAKIQSLYKMCMNETQLESIGARPLLDELQQLVTTVFPVQGSPLGQVFTSGTGNLSSSSSADRKALSFALVHLAKAGIPGLFVLSSREDPVNDPSILSVTVEEFGLSLLAKEFYQIPDFVSVFQSTVKESFGMVLGHSSKANADSLAQDVVAFEAQLANISTSAVEISENHKLFNPKTVQQLNQLNPAIDWGVLLEQILGNPSQNSQNMTVFTPVFQEKLGKLLAQTPAATLQNYFAWKTIMTQGTRLAAQYRRPLERLNALLKGADPLAAPPRWKTCASTVSQQMGPLVGYFYVSLESGETDRNAVIDMIASIKKAFRVRFPKLDWLDNKTLANAIDKLEAIEPLVGWSTADPNIGSPSDLESYFAPVKVLPGDFYGSMDQASRLIATKTFERAGKKVQRQRMFTDPQLTNAFYHSMTNQIVFPAGFIQPPMYRSGAPEYLNYGAIGHVAAHEITHGFDTSGRMFDLNGFLRDWWSEDTAIQFNTKAQCMIEQYSNFTIVDATNKTHSVDGRLTIGENIADNGAVQQAFQAWRSRYRLDRSGRRYDNQRLPGLEQWTRDQLFFIGFGQVLCTKMTPTYEQMALSTDNHAPPRWRVNGPVLNMPEFARAYKCRRGSPMNPTKQCVVW